MHANDAGTQQITEAKIEAEYPDLRHARQAIDALEWAGIEPADVQVAGPAVETPYYLDETRERDTRLGKAMFGRVARWVLACTPIGVVGGGIAGLVIGRAAGLDSYDAWLTCGLGALLGGLIGSYLGAFVGGSLALRGDTAVEEHFEQDVREHEPAVVSVRVASEASAQRAQTILQAKEPISVHRSSGRTMYAAGPR
jgi:hypothetical protein